MQNQAVSSAATPEVLNLGVLPNLGQGSWHLGWHDGRQYLVYTPLNYQVGTAVPLIMILHGCSQASVTLIAYDTHMNQLADTHQFLVVYPDHTDWKHFDINPIHCWNFFLPVHQHRDSGEPFSLAGIVHDLLRKTSHWTIDQQRIYVAGISSGAGAAVNLGVTYPDLFAAIGVHSGAEYGYSFPIRLPIGKEEQARDAVEPLSEAQALSGEEEVSVLPVGPDPIKQGEEAFKEMGSFARVVPTIVFHGTADHVVNPINGDQVTQQWLSTNQLASHGAFTAAFEHPSSTTIHPAGPQGKKRYTVFTWQDARSSDVVIYYKVDGMRHAWSGGSPGSVFTEPKGPDASQAIYEFFMAHPKETVSIPAKLQQPQPTEMSYGMWEMYYRWGTGEEHKLGYTLHGDGTYQTGNGITGKYWQVDGKIILYQADTQSVFSGDVVNGIMVGVSAEFTSDKRGSWYALAVK